MPLCLMLVLTTYNFMCESLFLVSDKEALSLLRAIADPASVDCGLSFLI